MPFKTQTELDTLRRDLYETVWPLISDFENKHWELKTGTSLDSGMVYRGEHKTIGAIWKLEARIDISPREFYEKIMLPPDMVGWVPSLTEYKVLEKCPDNTWEVTYSHLAAMGPVSARDTVALNFLKMNDEDGTFLAMANSTEHPDTPKNTGAVRAVYLPTAFYIKPIDGEPYKSMVYWMNNIDLKGYLLRSVVNMAMSTFLANFGKAIIKKSKEIAADRK